ncbi:MAG: amidase [Streptosporangiaceae bacterium]
MPIEPPGPREITRIARAFGLDLSDDERDRYAALLPAFLDHHRRLDELADTPLPVAYPRVPGHRPAAEDNPHHGWVWRCQIDGSGEGPLAGKRVAIKDNIAVAGMPMLNGTSVLEGFAPGEDATVVTRVLDAGGAIVGKTAVPSLCFDGAGVTCYPEPQPANPYDPAYLPGASSAGNAVVLVTGQADIAIGGDQGGSVRLPASWSGCVGHKPTHGLVPYTGAFPIEQTLDHLGPMARTVADCALLLEVLAGPDGLDPRQVDVRTQRYTEGLDTGLEGTVVGVLREGFGIDGFSEPDVDAAVRDAAETLAKGGATVEEVSVPMHRDGLAIWTAIGVEGPTELMVRGDGLGTNWKGHYSTALVDAYGPARRARAHDLGPTVIATVLLGAYLSDRYNHHYYAKAQNLGRVLAQRYDEALEQVDALLLPTTAMKALPRPENPALEEIIQVAIGTNLHNTTPFDVTGHPAISVPCAVSEGLPVGMMLVGRRFDDATVLRAGNAYERLRGPLPAPSSRG